MTRRRSGGARSSLAHPTAATGFLAAAALWLALASGLGVLAILLRIGEFKINFPLGLFELAFQLDERRVDAAFVNATVYGWLTNAALRRSRSWRLGSPGGGLPPSRA